MTSSSSENLAGTLETLATDTWMRLRDVASLASRSVRFGEETITDLLMLDLNRLGSTKALFTPTSKPVEAIQGTDFECWVGSEGAGWLRFAIQAKKLDLTKSRYNELGRCVKSRQKKQIKILEEFAQANRAAPLYCLYNFWEPADPQTHGTCCQRPFTKEQLGCTITASSTIQDVLKAPKGRKTFDYIHRCKYTVPWRCLAICPRIRASFPPGSEPSPPPEEQTDPTPLFEHGLNYFDSLPREFQMESVANSLASHSDIMSTEEFDPEFYSDDVDFPRRRIALTLDSGDDDPAPDK